MLKKYKAFMNNEGKFAQPGARALEDYISTYNQQVEADRVAQAVRGAEKRARAAEEQVREAEAHAREAEARAVFAETQSMMSRGSGETVTWNNRASTSTATSLNPSLASAEIILRERLFPAQEETSPVAPGSPQSLVTLEIPSRERLLPERNAKSEPVSPQNLGSTELPPRGRLFLERIPTRPAKSASPQDYTNPEFPPHVGHLPARATLSAPITPVSAQRAGFTRGRRPERSVPPPIKPEPKAGPKPKSLSCALCSSHCFICPNPWQRTRSDIMVSKLVEIDRPKPVPYGIVLDPCDHSFCGPCLAQAIYHNLNLAFDPTTYGTRLPSYPLDALSVGRPEFPIGCPRCQVSPDARPMEISDATARLVLGESNMTEWNHARFLSSINLIHCPHRHCQLSFDAENDVTAGGGSESKTRVECPHCRESLCRVCKSVWHQGLTCLMYQALPPDGRQAAVVPKAVKYSRRRGMTIEIPGDPPWVQGKQSFLSA
ncbi:hypothetical protein C8F04DRAFT_1085181 [Mycena alexandri]|uniref:IBR domain-containing protein n=1 Tax=Mycena alexandri TaxID=1745969 RepID=A0AAD6T622_9AGAR|nr:hypothetical protein C8F04DRAFT_1085181 [Mycena alexandri]